MTVRELVDAGGGRAHVGLGDGRLRGDALPRAQACRSPPARATRVLPFVRRWCHARGVDVVELGTSAGDRALFRRVPLDEAERRGWPSELAGRARGARPGALRARRDAVRARPRPRGRAQGAHRGRRGRASGSPPRSCTSRASTPRRSTAATTRGCTSTSARPAIAALLDAHRAGARHDGRARAAARRARPDGRGRARDPRAASTSARRWRIGIGERASRRLL